MDVISDLERQLERITVIDMTVLSEEDNKIIEQEISDALEHFKKIGDM